MTVISQLLIGFLMGTGHGAVLRHADGSLRVACGDGRRRRGFHVKLWNLPCTSGSDASAHQINSTGYSDAFVCGRRFMNGEARERHDEHELRS